jgi:hypothetical protein
VNLASLTSVAEFHDSTLFFCGTMMFPTRFDQTKTQKKAQNKFFLGGTPDIHGED